VHERRIERSANGEWLIVDKARGGSARVAESFIHLHPDVGVPTQEASRILCHLGDHQVSIEPFGFDSIEILCGVENPIQGWYFPDFGVAKPSPTIRLRTSVREGHEFGYRIRSHTA
jgi:uncharacterized heparinase superfamily protein